jgi:hypothetical protein
MAKDLDMLELRRMFKELEFFESDYEYVNEVVNGADPEFLGSVNDCLEEYPDLKDAYSAKMSSIANAASVPLVDGEEEKEDEESSTPAPSQKLKKLYREIVKKTHPDKVKDEFLNDLYVSATLYYENRDLISIYSICGELRIAYELESSDLILIKDKIDDLRYKIGFIQSTYTWKWRSSDDDNTKKKIVFDYISAQLKR